MLLLIANELVFSENNDQHDGDVLALRYVMVACSDIINLFSHFQNQFFQK